MRGCGLKHRKMNRGRAEMCSVHEAAEVPGLVVAEAVVLEPISSAGPLPVTFSCPSVC